MNLFELFVKIGAKDEASGTISKITSGLGKGLATAAKIGTAAVGAAAAGITALTKSAVDNYAEYEQLVGGVETLFNESADRVKQYANEAYKSAGLSANEYMSTVTGFSASLLQSLGRGAQTDLDALKENLDEQYDATKKSWQDRIKLAKKLKQRNVAELEAQMDAELKALKKGNEQKLAEAETANNKSVVTAETQALAADLANQAVIDMADNAAKMGTSMEMIQNAYAGFAKQNYTMLDNLKLGYGGTQSEMQRLIKDAAALDKSIDANSLSFANIVKAINVVQTKMGITGTTAKEAGRTISGSVGAMKSAWTNLVTGLADGNADIEGLINNLVTTIVGDGTENNLGVLGNIMPAVKMALKGAAKVVAQSAPIIAEELPKLIEGILPDLASATANLIVALAEQIPSMVQTLVDAAYQIVDEIGNAFAEKIPGLSWVFENLETVIIGVATALATLKVTMAMSALIDGLTKAWQAYKTANEGATVAQWLLNAAQNANPMMLVISLVAGLVAAIVTLWNTNEGFRNALISAWEAIKSAATNIFSAIANFFTTTIPNAFNSVIDWFKNIGEKFADIGKNIVSGLKEGISNAWKDLKKWFTGLFDDIIGIAKKILGIASPSKVFKKIGGFTAEGFGVGFEDEFAHVKDYMEDALNFDDASVGINASIRKVGASTPGAAFGGTSIGSVSIKIDGAKYSDEQALADAVAERIQNMTDRRAAIYA